MRYTRNRIVIGEEGQNKLLSSSIMIIGCGALGGQIAMLMAGSGIGTIGIADFDVINITNLHRQLFFSEGTIGELKAEVLSERMINLNSDVEVRVFKEKITEENAIKIFKDFDVIVDATDNPLSKYSIADITHKLGKHFISGGVEGWKGQVLTLLNDKDCPLIGEIFPMTPEELEFRSKGMIGVLGPAPSTIASIQAAEVMRILLYKEEVKSHLIFIDLKNSIFQSIEI